uniref:Uncharacterized protein n=1 Tax=viral metagenome TaxID=1070528 RepID=A0A6C0LE70_9ZZZZ
MSSQSTVSVSNRVWKHGFAPRDSSDYTKQLKSKILYTQLKSNVTRLSQSQKQSYNLQLDYNLGGVVCGGCTGGAVYTKLRVGS